MKNLFVGNMSFQTTESDLRALFEPFGQITRIHIVQDRETRQPRGFAFVEMAEDMGAAKAMTDLNGKEVSGRALRVNEATPRPERGGPSGDGVDSDSETAAVQVALDPEAAADSRTRIIANRRASLRSRAGSSHL